MHIIEFMIYSAIATLGLSWNLSLAEDLESLSLQDGPLSGIIFGQIANVWKLNYLSLLLAEQQTKTFPCNYDIKMDWSDFVSVYLHFTNLTLLLNLDQGKQNSAWFITSSERREPHQREI